MATTLRVSTKVLPGNRIEVPTPELAEGQTVNVLIVPEGATTEPRQTVLDFLNSLPPGRRSPEEWEAFEREFQEERNSWDR